MLLNNQQIREEIKKEIKICIETNENENTTTPNLWDTVKAVLRGRFIAVQSYLKKQDTSQINNLDQIRSVAQSCPTLCDPIDSSPLGFPHPWDSPGKNTGVGCHFLLQCMKVKVKSLSHVRLIATPWTAAHQVPPSMGFSRQEYWSEVPLPSLCFRCRVRLFI